MELEKNTNILNIEVDNYEDCSFCKAEKNKMKLIIPFSIWSEWLFISSQMGSKEWGAVFWVEKGKITRYQIPKQEVSYGECEFKEELGGDGMVHSHHTMGAFHSGQDDRHARNLYKYSIVISSTGSVCTTRDKLPCKGFGYKDTEIFISEIPERVQLDLIEERKYTYPVLGGGAQRNYETEWEKERKERQEKELEDERRRIVLANETEFERTQRLAREEQERLDELKDQAEYPNKCDFCRDFDCENCQEYLKLANNMKD